ncbi:glycosyltransferase N-terminal domain-containing protein [Fulvivirgaceae bacterium BMA12]|uniref:3-deoxy-D-manno-octulosonic acid transferase n=1 Tax=Agaribacillus aureus TaxID=3051825 RepID=A0ABT8L440_9BACT|nr:glycosyltransferase N-terminal domain-containing protein [Fulvivirgaceae bacterium BMA12]
MKLLLYNFLIQIYGLSIRLASLFNTKAKLFVAGRKNLFDDLSDTFKNHKTPIAWFHCASLGEFEQGRPVMEALKEQMPGYKILLTFFSPSGYEVRKNYQGADFIYYLPLDTGRNARRFIQITQPGIAFFVKYEFWHNYIQELKKQRIPIISFSTIFRADQLFFKPWGGFYRDILRNISHIFVQNDASLQLLKKINIKQASIAGDTRFDRVWKICQQVNTIEKVADFKGDNKLMVIGSSWPEDMEVLVPIINKNKEVKFIIAPHEIRDSDIKSFENELQHPTIRFSSLNNGEGNRYQVLIIDNVGMLSSLYQFGEFAYIGGGFGKGLHNILEAATFGLPIFFGNKSYAKFQEARDLIELQGAFAIADTSELSVIFDKLYNQPTVWSKTRAANFDYIKQNVGATQKILDHCQNLLPDGR